MIGFAVPPARAAAVPASRPATSKRKRAPRAVVRWRLTSSGSRAKRGTLTGAPADRVRRRMKIAVCAKVVPEQARRIDPETKRLDRSGEPTLNPFDANAVEEGLRLKGDAVVAVSDAINEPRYPSLKGIMGAKKKPQETVSLSDLGVERERAGESGSRTEVYALGEPPPRGETQRVEDDGSGAEKILEFLLERKAL